MTLRLVLAIARVEWLRLTRSRVTFTLLLLVPALQVVLFGLAIRPEAARVSVAVAAPTPESAASVVRKLDADQRFHRVGAVGVPGSAASAVRQGTAEIGIEIPETRSFANLSAPNVPARLIVDASQPTLTSAAEARLLARYWQDKAESFEAGGPEVRIERLFNPDARADWSFLPSLAGVTTMIAMIMLGSLAVSREREGGTWETLQSLPLRPGTILAGKLIPGIILGSVQSILVLTVALTAFAVPANGSIAALIAIVPLFAAAHLAIGYAISCAARTQLAGLQGAVAFYLPAMLLSGFLYPFETLPGWAQAIGNAFPLSHFIRAAHGATLRGDDALSVLKHGLPIAVALAVAVALALAIGRDRSGRARRPRTAFFWLVAGATAMFAFAIPQGLRKVTRAVSGEISLEGVDRQLRAEYPTVTSVDAAALGARIEQRDAPILLDVRSPEEFAVSHLPGALRVDPDANDAEVLKAIGSAAEGRDIIFYCSVGVRSTMLAQRVHAALAKNGAGAIANLSGGIFAWHNADRRLVGVDGKTTDLVHPFDGEWGRLVKRQDRVSYRPGSLEVNAVR